MVSKDRLKVKLPELLVDGPVTEKANFDSYRRFRYHLDKLEKANPLVLDRKLGELQKLLEDLASSIH